MKIGDTVTAGQLVGLKKDIYIAHGITIGDDVHSITFAKGNKDIVVMNYNENQNISFGADNEYYVADVSESRLKLLSGAYIMQYGKAWS